MSDEMLSSLVIFIRHYLTVKYGEYKRTVDALDAMDHSCAADIQFARQQRTWRKHAMAAIKKCYSDCTVRNMRRILSEAGVSHEHSVSQHGTSETGSGVLPFQGPNTTSPG